MSNTTHATTSSTGDEDSSYTDSSPAVVNKDPKRSRLTVEYGEQRSDCIKVIRYKTGNHQTATQRALPEHPATAPIFISPYSAAYPEIVAKRQLGL